MPVNLASGWKCLLSFFPYKPSLSVAKTGRFLRPVEYLYPSEDGEALPKCGSEDVQPDVVAMRDGLSVTSKSQWFAVYTNCRHEKRIAQHMAQREIEHYLPLYRADRKWRDGSKVTLDLPLFPSYIFVRIKRSERVRILSIPGALAVVGGTGGEPATVPDAAIEALRVGLREHRIEPHPLLRVGQMARIRSGAFTGMEGIVVRRKSGCRVVLTLEQIMQSIAVEVDENDLECVTSVIAGSSFDAAQRFRWQEAS